MSHQDNRSADVVNLNAGRRPLTSRERIVRLVEKSVTDHRFDGDEKEAYFELLSSMVLEQLLDLHGPEWMIKHLTDHISMVLHSTEGPA